MASTTKHMPEFINLLHATNRGWQSVQNIFLLDPC